VAPAAYQINYHVRANIDARWHYGYIVDVQRDGVVGWKYQVDFYSWGLGKAWIPESEIFIAKNSRNPKKILVVIQIEDSDVRTQAGDRLYAIREPLRTKLSLSEISFLRGSCLKESLSAMGRHPAHSIIVIADTKTFNATKTELQNNGASCVYPFSGNTADQLAECFARSVMHFAKQ
jgi:hypothetical protein